jgi:hypothetical protein
LLAPSSVRLCSDSAAIIECPDEEDRREVTQEVEI